jgi:integrase
MRKGEIMGLRWDNIDLKAGFIHVTEDESMGQSVKNGEGRSIPINNTLRTVLDSLPVRIDGGKLFTTAFHGDCFVDALKRAKIRNFHFHDLRHTFASNLAMGGCDLATLKELLGHRTVAMTLRYSHLSGEHKRTAVKILDAPVSNEAVSL